MPYLRMILAILYVMLLLTVLACAGPTGYTKRNDWNSQYGYSDKPIGNDEFSVVVTGNPITSKERVAQIALLRAAHLTQEEGRTHFCILKQKVEILNAEKLIAFPVVVTGIIVPVPVKTKANEEPTAILLIRILPVQAFYAPEALSASEIIGRFSQDFAR